VVVFILHQLEQPLNAAEFFVGSFKCKSCRNQYVTFPHTSAHSLSLVVIVLPSTTLPRLQQHCPAFIKHIRIITRVPLTSAPPCFFQQILSDVV